MLEKSTCPGTAAHLHSRDEHTVMVVADALLWLGGKIPLGRDTGLYVFNIEPLRLPNEEASCLHFLFFYFESLLIAPDQILGEPALATCTERTADCRHGWQLHLCASRAQGQSGSPNPASSQLPRPTVIENWTPTQITALWAKKQLLLDHSISRRWISETSSIPREGEGKRWTPFSAKRLTE